jgi:hypothetical protein
MPRLSRKRRAAATILAAAAALLALAAPSLAEVVQKDGVRVKLAAEISPTALPRSGGAPVALSLSSRIVPTTAGDLPKLERIAIAINSHGELQSKGIPVCRLGKIKPSTTAQALAACRSSLVGEGRFSASIAIAEQSPFPSEGKVLAFNGKLNGKPALFAHIYGVEPVPTSYVLPFLIGKAHGAYGALLEASLPAVTGEWGYVTGVDLDLQSRYLSAACPAPPGFTAAPFPLMKTSFDFQGGPKLDSTLTRNCKVRR